MPVTDKDKGWKRIRSTLAALRKSSVRVGIQPNQMTEDGQNLAQVAFYNEYGTMAIPSRPFMRTTLSQNREALDNLIDQQVNEVYTAHVEPRQFMGRIGAWYSGQMKDTITIGPWVKNTAATIKRKGSSKPLIDTGNLRATINYKVVL